METKLISRFQPLDRSRVDEYDAYYTDVHTRHVRENFRNAPGALSYHQDRVRAQLDIAGGWNAPLAAWRFVTTRYSATDDASAKMTGGERRVMEADHRYFCRDLRTCAVDEEVLVDRLSRQTTTAKYILEVDRASTDAAADGVVRTATDRVATAAADAFGVRLVIRNWVLDERESATLDVAGQGLPGAPLPTTDKVAYLEVYVDQQQWGEELFADVRADLDALRDHPGVGMCALYRVEESCGVDHR